MSDAAPHHSEDVVIHSDPAEARRVQDVIESHLRAHDYGEHDIFGIRLALEEAMVNAIKHGNNMDRTKKVQISYRVRKERFDISIADEGPGFDPLDVPDPTAVENLERPCGRGLMLMRHYMTSVEFGQSGNVVRMCKVLSNGSK
jgi:serine/threonine-protein kinase RsbW